MFRRLAEAFQDSGGSGSGSGTGNSQRVALRFQYPSAERAVNKANVEAAVASQFGGSDDINAKMWIIK